MNPNPAIINTAGNIGIQKVFQLFMLSIFGLALFTLAACSHNPKLNKNLDIIAAQDLNPDSKGKPLSAVIQIYQLSQIPHFSGEGWSDAVLYDEPYKINIEFILHHQEAIILPGQRLSLEIPPTNRSKFLLLTAHIRQRDIHRWRLLIDPSKLADQSTYVLENCGWRVFGRGVIRLHQQAAGKPFDDNIRAVDIHSEACITETAPTNPSEAPLPNQVSPKKPHNRGFK